jgi:MoaA/NifB/PqqE/SkfB family radical SAM enzyme
MPYLKLNDLEAIVIDFTSHCNSMCGNCSRNIDGVTVNPRMPLQHMSLETWKNLFTPEVANQIKEVIFNGSYGDPIFNPNLIPALEYLLEITNKPPVITIHTNGGLGTQWKELAEVMQKFPEPSHVTFSIDGLEDTNHLYRRGVLWDKIMTNAQTYIEAGGLARWRMLVFEHNAHQIEECEQLALSMGFKKFDINGGHTFSAINSLADKAIEKFKANKKDQAREIKYDSKYLDNVERIKGIEDFSTSIIKCKWQVKRKVQISHTGEVFPCCYFLSDRWPRNPDSPYAKDVEKIEWLNVDDYSLEEILNSEWFATYLPESWKNENRYDICSKVCGT